MELELQDKDLDSWVPEWSSLRQERWGRVWKPVFWFTTPPFKLFLAADWGPKGS